MLMTTGQQSYENGQIAGGQCDKAIVENLKVFWEAVRAAGFEEEVRKVSLSISSLLLPVKGPV